jgi:PAS domain-containing protein
MNSKTVLKVRARGLWLASLMCLMLSSTAVSAFAGEVSSPTSTGSSGVGGLQILSDSILLCVCVTIPALMLIYLLPAAIRQKATAQRARELQQGQQRIGLALEAGRSGIWELNLSNNRLHWDWRTRNMFDVAPAETELSFEDFSKRLHPEDRERVEVSFNDSVDTGTPFSCNYRVIYRDSSVHDIHMQGRAIFDEIDKPRLFIGICHDLTEQQPPPNRVSDNGHQSANQLNRAAMEDHMAHLGTLIQELSWEVQDSPGQVSPVKDQPNMIAGRIRSAEGHPSSE